MAGARKVGNPIHLLGLHALSTVHYSTTLARLQLHVFEKKKRNKHLAASLLCPSSILTYRSGLRCRPSTFQYPLSLKD